MSLSTDGVRALGGLCADRWDKEPLRPILGLAQAQPREPLTGKKFALGLKLSRPFECADVIMRLGGKPVGRAGQCRAASGAKAA